MIENTNTTSTDNRYRDLSSRIDKINQTLCAAMSPSAEHGLVRVIFADKRRKSIEYKKVTMRPISIRGEYMYQAEFHYYNKVTHKNISYFEGVDFALDLICEDFKQVNILTTGEDIQILASKPDKPRITIKPARRNAADLSHDKRKNYILADGTPCDFLIELGVMSPDGNVYKNHYAKFRQINRFLEIADDAFRDLPKTGTIRVIDFGCGKSYLTFALYYYLKLVRERDVEIIGLDLKDDVIKFCNSVSHKLGYAGLKFLIGDIADFESDGADMVVTLHACDTATDYALINAVRWNSRVILSVPCCQHELFSQISEPTNNPMLKHGIIKDKFTELLTDALRGLKLEAAGYKVDMIEFTSLEHTSKNIMIRAIRDNAVASTCTTTEASATHQTPAMKRASHEYETLKNFYGVKPTIDLL